MPFKRPPHQIHAKTISQRQLSRYPDGQKSIRIFVMRASEYSAQHVMLCFHRTVSKSTHKSGNKTRQCPYCGDDSKAKQGFEITVFPVGQKYRKNPNCGPDADNGVE